MTDEKKDLIDVLVDMLPEPQKENEYTLAQIENILREKHGLRVSRPIKLIDNLRAMGHIVTEREVVSVNGKRCIVYRLSLETETAPEKE